MKAASGCVGVEEEGYLLIPPFLHLVLVDFHIFSLPFQISWKKISDVNNSTSVAFKMSN